MPGASPLADDLDTVKRLEDAGASAIVMHSLFEEQIVREQMARHRTTSTGTPTPSPRRSPTSRPRSVFALGPDTYLEQLRRIRAAVAVPVIASLNGTTPGGWIELRAR